MTYATGAADAAQSTLTPTSATLTANGTATQVLTVQAKDANGNNLTVGGATVTITRSSGTGAIGSVTDNGNGTYTATVTAPTTVGSGVFVATLNSAEVKSGGSSQTQATVTYATGAATVLVRVTGDGTSAPVGTAAPPPPAVKVVDALGNPVGNVAVTFAVSTGGGGIESALLANLGSNYTTGGSEISQTAWKAFLFTTGGSSAAVRGISLLLNAASSSSYPTTIAGVKVAIHSVSGGLPNSELAASLAVSVPLTAARTWQAFNLTTPLTLAANTAYALVVSGTDTTGFKWAAVDEAGNSPSGFGGATFDGVRIGSSTAGWTSDASVRNAFTLTVGSGAVSSVVVTSTGSGVAALGTWTLGATAGANTVTATSGSLTGSPMTFTATGLDGTSPLINGPSGGAGAATSAKSIAENTTAVHAFTANESVTWSLPSGPDAVRFSISAVGVLRFGSAPNFESPNDVGDGANNNTYVLVVRATDGAGNTAEQTVTVTVTDVDDEAPLINGPSGGAGAATSTKSIAENTTAVHTFTANELVTWSVPSGADAVRFSISAAGILRFDPAPNFESPTDAGDGANNNTYVVVVRATDGAGNTAEQTVTVTVTNVNEAPAGTDKTVVMDEDSTYPLKVADFGFTDVDAGTALKAVVVATVPTAGSLRLNGTAVSAGTSITVAEIVAGKLMFAPVANGFGAPYATFTFQVQDDGGVASGGVDLDPTPNAMTVEVRSLNDVPVPGLKADGTGDAGFNPTAGRYEVVTPEDTQLTGSVRANDPDGDTLFYTPGTTLPQNGTLSVRADGTYTYTPTPDFNGTDTFTIVVSDGKGGQAVITVQVTVTAVNDVPVVDLDAAASGTGYSVSYTHGTDAVPLAAVSVTVSDPDSPTLASATVTLTNPKTGDVLAATTLPAGITASISGSTLTLSGAASPSTYQTALRAVTFANPAGNADTATRLINVTVNDGTASSAVAVASIAAKALNRPSALTPDSATNGPSDATYVEGSLPVLVAPRLTLGDLDEWQTFTGATVTITSGSEAGDRLLANVTGTPINAAYDATAKRLSLSGTASRAAYEAVLKSVRFDSLQNPTDRDRALAFAITDAENGVTANTGVVHVRILELAPNPNNLSIVWEDLGGPLGIVEADASGGLKDFNFKAVAQIDGKATDVAALVLANPNVVARVAFLSIPVSDDLRPKGELRLSRTGTETVVFPTSANPLRVEFLELASGAVRYLPLPDEYGVRYAKIAYRVEVLTADGGLLLASSPDAVMYVAVRNVNDAPIGLPVPAASLLQGQSYEIDLNSVFREKDPDDIGKLTFTVSSDPALAVAINGSIARVTALAAQALNASLIFTARDSSGATGATSAAFALRGAPPPVNTPPTLTFTSVAPTTPGAPLVPTLGNLAFDLPEGLPAILNAKGVDADGDTLTYKLSGLDAAVLQVSPSGVISATKPLDFEKPSDTGRDNVYNFTVTVEDGRGGSASSTVAVRITNVVEGAQATSEAALNFPVTVNTSTGGSSSVDLSKIFQNLDGTTAVNFEVANRDQLAVRGITAKLLGSILSLSVPGNFSGFADIVIRTAANGITTDYTAKISVDADRDGVDDFTEAFAGDLNGDGKPDNEQYNVASFPGVKSDIGDPRTYFGLAATPTENAYVTTKKETTTTGGSLAMDLRVGGTLVGDLSDQQQAALKQTLNQVAQTQNKEVADLQVPIGVVGFNLKPEIIEQGTVPPAERSTFEANVRNRFASEQNTVRVVLPKGSNVNTFIKFDANGQPYEFKKEPLIGRFSPTGQQLYTGCEFVPHADGTPGFKEAILYFVDNERGDSDPAVGQINDPGVFAFIGEKSLVKPTTTGISPVRGSDGAGFSFDVSGSFTDPNGSALTYAAVGLPAGLTIDARTGIISGNLGRSASAASPYAITVTASNVIGSVSSTFALTVANPSPLAADDAAVVTAGEAVSGMVAANDSDPDGDLPLIFAVVTSPVRGSVVMGADGRFTYTAGTGAAGPDSFTYSVTDAQGSSATARVSVTVNAPLPPPNKAPTGSVAAQTGTDGARFSLSLANGFRDPEGGALSYSVSGLPPSLVLDAATGVISGVLRADASARQPYEIRIVVRDAQGASTEASFTFGITNPAPRGVDDTFLVQQDRELRGDVGLNDSDPDGDLPLTFRVGQGPANGTLALSGSGTFTYRPAPGFIGADRFTYIVADSQGTMSTAAVALSVHAPPVNVPGWTEFDVGAGAQTLARDGKALFRTSDRDSDELTVMLSALSGYLSLADPAGVTLVAGTGLNDKILTLRGGLAALNQALARISYQSPMGASVRDIISMTSIDPQGLTDTDEIILRTTVSMLAGDTVGLTTPEISAALSSGGSIRIASYDPEILANVTLKPESRDVAFEMTAVNRWDGSTESTRVVVEITGRDGSISSITIPLVVYHPKFEVISQLRLNPETSLYEQRVRVVNLTPVPLAGVRITLSSLAAGVSLYTTHGLASDGAVYVEPAGSIAAGTESTFLLEFFSSSVSQFPQPSYSIRQSGVSAVSPSQGQVKAIGRVVQAGGRTYVEFSTVAGSIYWVQYRDSADAAWQTSPAAVTGTGTSIQWLDDGWPKTSSAPTASRNYQLLVTSATSGGLRIISQPRSQQVALNGSVNLTVAVEASSRSGLSFQWFKDGRLLVGATSAQLSIPSFGPSRVGDYHAEVSDGSVVLHSAVASLSLADSAAGRIVNLSVLASVEPDNVLIAGFSVSGSSSLRVLHRAVGPTLANFGVESPVADPNLILYNGVLLGTNENWDQDIAAGQVASVAQGVGAFSLPAGSTDAALLRTLLPGTYSVHGRNRGSAPATLLAEVYDAGTAGDARFTNISSRNLVGLDGSTLTAGFVVSGEQPVRVLIRGVGPALASFGVNDALNDPMLTLRRSDGTIVDLNDDWSAIEAAIISNRIFPRVGAFDLPRGSRDAVLDVRLPAGAYTATVSSKAGAVGQALLEVYVIE